LLLFTPIGGIHAQLLPFTPSTVEKVVEHFLNNEETATTTHETMAALMQVDPMQPDADEGGEAQDAQLAADPASDHGSEASEHESQDEHESEDEAVQPPAAAAGAVQPPAAVAAPPAAGAVPPGAPPAAMPPGAPLVAVHTWEDSLAKHIDELGVEQIFEAVGPMIAAFFLVNKVSTSLLRHHHVDVPVTKDAAGNVTSTKVMCMGSTRGAERVATARAWVHVILSAGPGAGIAVSPYAFVAALIAVLEATDGPAKARKKRLFVPSDDSSSDGGRNTSPAAGTRSKSNVYAKAKATEEAKRGLIEMPSQEIDRRSDHMYDKYGNKAPTRSTTIHPNQLKRLCDEMVGEKIVPSSATVQPSAMLVRGGVNGLRAPNAEKGKDVAAPETTCPMELRARFHAFCEACGIVTCFERDGEETYSGAMEMVAALQSSTKLVTHAQVAGALDACMSKARRACNGGNPAKRASIGEAFSAGAEVIYAKNEDVSTVTPTKGDAGDGAKSSPMTEKDIRAVITAAMGKGKPAGAGGDGKKKESGDVVTLADGTKKRFARKKGGNPECPVACTKNHPNPKEVFCSRNHSGF
jgi:hypothetical protein